MESNNISEGLKNPIITFTKENLSISGYSIDVHPEHAYSPLIDWIKKFSGSTLKIEINLTLVNCNSVKLLLQAMVAADLNKNIEQKTMTWFFKDKDELELGEMISSNLKYTKVKFYCMN